MEYLIRNKKNKESKSEIIKYWQDNLIHEFYIDYYNNLSSRELDQEFRKDIKNITTIMSELSDSDRKVFVKFLSNFIEFYIDQKIEKELDTSLYRILKTL